MREIVKDGKILARHITPEDIKPGLLSFTNDDEFIQVVSWGHYEKGKYLQDHWHNEFEREARRTYEVVYVVKGAIEARLFDLDLVPVEKLTVNQGEMLILLEAAFTSRTRASTSIPSFILRISFSLIDTFI